MHLLIQLKPQSFLGQQTPPPIWVRLGANHHQKIVNMLLSTRQTRRWAFSLKLWNVIEISTRAMDSNKRDMYSRWMNRFMYVYKRIGKNCAHEKHDKHSHLSRESKYWCWLDRGSLHWNSVTCVVRQKKKKRGSSLHHRLVRSITALLHIFIDYSYYFYSSERRQTLCMLNLLNLTMKLTLQSHQNHPNMSPRYTLMLKKCLLSCLVERIQTAHSQRTRILKRLASEWKKNVINLCWDGGVGLYTPSCWCPV